MKYILLLAATVILSACNTENKPDQQALIKTPTGLSGLQSSAPIAPTAESKKSNLIVNPPHGQPGHNCDIAEGAPLNKVAPAKIAEPQAPTQVIPPVTAAVPVEKNTSNKNLNPAHGKPGHRCDIAEGEPLNSKPKTAAAPAITTQSKPVVTPDKNTQEVKNGAKLNPKHGDPGHDCAIAVGAPLT